VNFIRGYDPRTGKELWRLGRSSKNHGTHAYLWPTICLLLQRRGPERRFCGAAKRSRRSHFGGLVKRNSEAIVWSRTGRGIVHADAACLHGTLYVLGNNGLFDATI